MTDLARRVLSSLQKRAVTALEEPPRPPAPEQRIEVDVRLPGELLHTCEDGVTEALRRQLSVLVHQLDLHRGVEVTAREAPPGGAAVTVSIDRRPAGVLPVEGLDPESAVEPLVVGILSRTLRRLPLLAGPGVRARSTAAYLLALGCRAPATGDAVDALDVEEGERSVDERTAEAIVLEVPASTMRRVTGDEALAIAELRASEFRLRGVRYPDVHVVLSDGPPGRVGLRLNDVTLPARRLGEEARWTDVVRYVGQELTSRRHWFVRMRHVAQALDEDLIHVFPDLVAVTGANYSLAQVTACLRELARSGRRIRNLPGIMWRLIEASGAAAESDVLQLSESPLLPKARYRPPAPADPILQAVRVRKLGAEETWRVGTYQAPRHPVRLAEDIEERLVAEWPPEGLARAEWAAVRALATAPGATHVVTRTVYAVGPVQDALQAGAAVPRVVASHELPPDADVDAIPVLPDPEDSG